MARRRRLTPAQPGYLGPASPQDSWPASWPEALPALETKSALPGPALLVDTATPVAHAKGILTQCILKNLNSNLLP